MNAPVAEYFKIQCALCGGSIECPDEAYGQTIDCPHCASSILPIRPAPPQAPLPKKKSLSPVAMGVLGAFIIFAALIATVILPALFAYTMNGISRESERQWQSEIRGILMQAPDIIAVDFDRDVVMVEFKKDPGLIIKREIAIAAAKAAAKENGYGEAESFIKVHGSKVYRVNYSNSDGVTRESRF